MPAQAKHDTLQRLLELLKALPHHGWARWDTRLICARCSEI